MVDAIRRDPRATLAAAGHIAFAAAASAPVLAILLLGCWNRFLADDYAVAFRLEEYGLIGSWIDQLGDLNGRFAGYFLTDVLVSAGPRGSWIATALVLVALVGAVHLAVPADNGADGRHWSPGRTVGVLALVGAVIVATPAPDEAFLWVSGVGMVTASLVASALAVAFAQRAARTKDNGRVRAVWFAATFAAAFVASGAYESTAFVLTIAGGAAAVAIGWRHRWSFAAAATIAAGAAAGLCTVAAIPGSRIRKELFPTGKPVLVALDEGWEVARILAEKALPTSPVLLAFLGGVLCVAPDVPGRRLARWLACAVAGAMAAVAAVVAFSIWVFGSMPPLRTMGVPAAVWVTTAFVAGWLLPAPRSWRPWLATAACCLTVYASLPFFDLVPERRAWAADWDRRDALLVYASAGDVVEVPRLWEPDGFDDIGDDPTFWVNEVAARYYGVRQVVAVPPEDYVGCWASMTRNGSTSCGSPSTSTITP